MPSENYIYIFKSNGFYFAFVANGNLYSRDGVYLGWTEGKVVWDKSGRFRGIITKLNDRHYIIFNQLTMPPVMRTPKPTAMEVTPPTPVSNIAPISLPITYSDAFE